MKWEELPSEPAQRQRILASCSRRSELFNGMVESIMGRKEELERIRKRGDVNV